ncbi:MAG TPA: tryptophan 2,3-dioxygenase family protein [Candidatus Thermoplasmatota archaeon]|nr:tryptophan 2,3-dioxygenase family protein [Candidatus Thermoplasmatota archaeon]
MPGQPHAALTYGSYLKLDELLSLQEPRSDGPEHDEMLFIVIHQVYELWFKQVLHEMDALQRAFEKSDVPGALAGLNRVRTILKTLVSQVDILETMTPVSFSSFRSRLDAASGFQSAQFRELEMILGRRHRHVYAHMPEGSARDRLEARHASPTLWDAFLKLLASQGHDVPAEVLARDVREPYEPNAAVQETLVAIYRKDFGLMQLCERMVDIDEGLQEWRYRHVKMVERTIGTKTGTGGSAGAEYLKQTIFKPHFPDLWAIRASL